ncbi:hypothetical protein COW36_23840 [bacterium (Candidatus Blackallbacteria) CG17_big_fil_post_rev_8_21_14_2_50_48_46]|uniref:PABS domain-containing protein n=1 Tax=bacterium (Candidatus Blackallbacteria) CG17_big_fil_post_rev_8_21_14_2_50_48_46 TaxID=2014261 RepID=A0A2M7FY66_9BACT|nr:MAG: hypothetical protein COW64_18780 [bacterium (Candidatus Blackallbacteria) CG18_big_fil_WC_8_21_14_2_50_49_26]PIW13706.1 MAG: hypothetical protein COW36_23840 [bacterium (Candidatus Blackallbacteria) CG17_big_fil_post_rev_8_21_14_2_50_48_46]PIW44932.1 MAG: hypothetical protein COW20_21470 [bacterium (Candidatus Blackallbacteria) CG13_big_fil_rev_8_21_14_2_50_49_14]
MGIADLPFSKESAFPIKRFIFILTLFISGFCGISYEILYSRALGNIIGNSFVLNASILIMFLLGIGIGTKIAHKLEGYLWLIEASIGLYALLFIALYPSLDAFFYQVLPAGNILLTILACALLLCIPTVLIGCSLPLFADLFQEMIPGKIFDLSYMIYNFGASVTAFAIEFYLIRSYGIMQTLAIILCLNFLSGLLLVGFFRKSKTVRELKDSISFPPRLLAALCLLSIASAIFQLLAIKIAEFIFGPFHETFAMVVSLVLLGIALGSLLSRYLKLSFGFFTISSTFFLVLILALFQPLVFRYAAFYAHFSESTLIVLKMLILACFMLWLSIGFGAAIPSLLTSDESEVAKESGHLLFVSSLANAFGYLLMVLYIHSHFNYGQILLIILSLLALAAVIYDWPNRKNMVLVSIALFLGLGAYLSLWNENLLYLSYKAFSREDTLRQKMGEYKWGSQYRKYEDVFSINKVGDQEFFFINGYISMALNSAAEYMVGTLSSLVSPRTQHALVLGLGSGSTGSTVTQVFDKTDIVEINPVIVEHQDDMKEHNFNIAHDPRAQIILDDGIRYLKNTPQKYDLILNTVTSPLYFSSSKLYTVDFFRHIKSRLKPDGVYTTWIDNRIGEEGFKIILKSLHSEFKYAWTAMIRSSYFLLLCSNQPIALHQQEAIEKNTVLKEFFMNKHGRSLDSIKYAIVSTDTFGFLDEHSETQNIDLNSIDKPNLEFAMSALSPDANIDPFKHYLEKNYSIEQMRAQIPADPLKLATHFTQLQSNSSFIKSFIRQAYQADPKLGQPLEARLLREYQLAWEQHPSLETGKQYAQWLERYRKKVLANQVWRKMFTLFPEEGYVYYKMSKLFREENDIQNAELYLKKALDKSPDNQDYRYTLAEMYFEQHRFLDSEEQLQTLLKQAPAYHQARYRLGRLYYFQEDFDRAEKSFAKALSFQKENELYTYWMGRSLFAQKEYKAAKSYFERSLKQDPESKETLKWLKKSILSEI